MRKIAICAIAFFISLPFIPAKDLCAFQIVEATRVAEVAKDMLMPTDAAFDEQGTLYVLDGYHNRIVVRQADGALRTFTPEGPCGLNKPLGITAHNRNIYIADTGNGHICELDSEGRCLRRIPEEGKKTASPFSPTDIAVEGSTAVVADRGSNLVHTYAYPSFERIVTIRELGTKGGTLNSPYLLDMHNGRILVTDIMNGRLVLISAAGSFLNSLGERGVREGQFIRPKGVSVGPDGYIYISDSALGVVQVFTMDFNYVGTVGNRGSPLYFKHPAGLATRGDVLAVVEQKGNSVALLRITSPATGSSGRANRP